MSPSDRPTNAETVAVWDCGKLLIEVYVVPGNEHDPEQYYQHSTWTTANNKLWSSSHDRPLGTNPTPFITDINRDWWRAYKPAPLPKPTQMELI